MSDQCPDLNWEDLNPKWYDSYWNGFEHGQKLSRTLNTPDKCLPARKHLKAFLQAFPKEHRSNSMYIALRGIHDGIYGIQCMAPHVILNGIFPDDL